MKKSLAGAILGIGMDACVNKNARSYTLKMPILEFFQDKLKQADDGEISGKSCHQARIGIETLNQMG